MPCQHLIEIKDLKLPVSDADVLKVLCPICGQIDVCAYTPVNDDQESAQPVAQLDEGEVKP